ncbi:MAG: urate oxidase [Acidimicrobiia bacterium]|nr:urate oxidase [Acidimicrobiia bacterium]
MKQFASGPKRHYYGKGDVIAFRLHRAGQRPGGRSPVFGASVLILLYGDAFWPTYATGDNTDLVATDSMKNFVQRETLRFDGDDLEAYGRFLGERFLETYPQTEGVQVSAAEIPYERIGDRQAFAPGGPQRATARVEIGRAGIIDVTSGIEGFQLMRLGGSAFEGFVRDEYTTLPDAKNRPLHMWLDVEWRYGDVRAAFTGGTLTVQVRQTVLDLFASVESRSIQQLIHRIGTSLLAAHDAIAEIRLEAQNRTWDTIAEQGEQLGVYTQPRPAYGCLGLTLTRA